MKLVSALFLTLLLSTGGSQFETPRCADNKTVFKYFAFFSFSFLSNKCRKFTIPVMCYREVITKHRTVVLMMLQYCYKVPYVDCWYCAVNFGHLRSPLHWFNVKNTDKSDVSSWHETSYKRLWNKLLHSGQWWG